MRAMSYAAGTDTEPLLGETIGANLDRTDRCVPRPRRARRPVPGRALHVPEVRRRSRPRGACAPGAGASRRVIGSGIWSPNCAEWVVLQYATAAGRCDPRQHQPRLSGPRARLRRGAIRVPRACSPRPSSRRATTAPWSTRSRPDLAAARAGRVPRYTATGSVRRARGRGRYRRRRPAGGRAQLRRSDQHPVHERHDGLPEGRDAQPPQHLEQRLLRRRGMRVHRGRPRLHPGAALPLLRHGARQPRLHDARRRDGVARARLRAAERRSRRSRPNGARASTACRRCSSPSSISTTSRRSTCRRCGRGSWPARRARSR